MSEWSTVTLDDVLKLQRGHDLPSTERISGAIPIIGSSGVTGFHSTARYPGPGVAIGRSGASIGTATYVAEDYWPLNTCLFVKDFRGNDERWVYRLLDSVDFLAFNSGSAQPSLNRNFLGMIPVARPPLGEQGAIAEVLGALDDKIAANTRLAATADELAGATYDAIVRTWNRIPMSDVLSPVLGGTPSRANEDFWNPASDLWISARDVTSAPSRVVLDTVEKISPLATAITKAKPLPAGSVILTARGTVGAVARIARPAAFNQSCYGFSPTVVPAGVLFYSVLRVSEHAQKIAHGSVFDTITMSTFDHLEMAWDPEAAPALNAQLAPLLQLIDATLEENRTLAATRDALLPKLMSGQIRVKDAEKIVEGVGV